VRYSLPNRTISESHEATESSTLSRPEAVSKGAIGRHCILDTRSALLRMLIRGFDMNLSKVYQLSTIWTSEQGQRFGRRRTYFIIRLNQSIDISMATKRRGA
jgi:hypothetical protein